MPGPLKRLQRSLDKIDGDYAGSEPWPPSASLLDIVRCTIILDDPYAMAVFVACALFLYLGHLGVLNSNDFIYTNDGYHRGMACIELEKACCKNSAKRMAPGTCARSSGLFE